MLKLLRHISKYFQKLIECPFTHRVTFISNIIFRNYFKVFSGLSIQSQWGSTPHCPWPGDTHFFRGNVFWHNTGDRHCASLCAAGAAAPLRSGLCWSLGGSGQTVRRGEIPPSLVSLPLSAQWMLETKHMMLLQYQDVSFGYCTVSLVSLQP